MEDALPVEKFVIIMNHATTMECTLEIGELWI
jgi:hypothetical protein